MKRFFGAILFLGAAQTAFGGVYDVKFRRVAPSSDAAACRSFTEKTVNELVRQTGARVISSGCQVDDYTLRAYDSIITYQAPAALAFTSTSTISVYSGTFFTSLETCNARLERQRELFTQATGLPALTAYCSLGISSPSSWETRVDGIGKSEIRPYAAGTTIWGSLVDAKAVLEDLLAVGKSYDISIFEVGISSNGMGHQIVVRHYAKEPMSFRDYDEMKYDTVPACATAAVSVKAGLQSAAKPVVIFCEKDGSGKATLHATSFVDTLKPVGVFKAQVLTTAYPTSGECEQAAANIVDGTPEDIFGAYCAGASGNFRIHLFSRPGY